MTRKSAQNGVQPLRVAGQFAGLVAGPVAWAAHQNLSNILVTHVCETDSYWPLMAVTALALAVVTIAGYASLTAMPDREEPPRREADRKRHGRGHLLGIVSVSVAVLSFSGIIVESVPIFVLDPCAGVP